MPAPLTLAIALSGVFLIAFMKGAFGGGFAIVGIPLLSLAMDPIAAGALLAPLFVVMDVTALRYWRPNTWSRVDLAMLLPALIVGIGLGYFALRDLDRHAVEVVMGLVTLVFAAIWLLSGGEVRVRPRSTPKAMLAGFSSGVTTMVAHSGGPPLAMYLLPLGMSKALYAGTTSLFFTVGNLLKAGPWLALATPTKSLWMLMALCAPAAPAGVWAGWRLHERLDQRTLYRACYAILVVTAAKLLWDGLAGYVRS
ncbi:permease [Bradyrhizobium jicamae]|uniref:Probable membrane transporter protein n=1 Tax=Bradyrhizobium jicamae TaxID=280332 RepID=A0A0R3KJF2_9BRAD|nr:sulfite exporter TauE/SafE family protein [Bradyrhizobium jicamae]KRQ95872.1 permease [Bradyrhizobium jicamae]